MKKITVFLFASVAMAAPLQAASYRMMFDAFSPAGIECTAEAAPDGGARVTRSVFGNPVVLLTGDVRQARILCRTADGMQWEALAHRDLPKGTMRGEATVSLRAGARAGQTVIDADHRDIVLPRSFVPLVQD